MDQSPHPDDFAIANQISLVDQRFLTLKHNDMFGIFDQRGDIRPGAGGTAGLYFHDTRYLSEYELLLGGQRLNLLSATLRDDNATLSCDLSNPDLQPATTARTSHEAALASNLIPSNLIHVNRARFLWQRVCHERIAIRNFDEIAHELTVELRYGSDFVDLFEVRGMCRARHGRHEAAEVTSACVTLAYVGLDETRRATQLCFDPPPERIDAGRALFRVALPPHGNQLIFVRIGCDAPCGTRSPAKQFFTGLMAQRRWTRHQSARASGIDTSNAVFNEAMRRAISDLTMLTTDKPTGPYPYAGIPWFSTAFGRDAIITALNVLWLDPLIALGVLRYLAATQTHETNAASDAEPGKIIHEIRNGEMALLGEVPFRRYYGSIDSTPLFVMLAGAYLERTGDVASVRDLWPSLSAALAWIDVEAERDRDGFIFYARRTSQGLANQGWKDSFDSISHEDGSLAQGPIALCEVQGYVFAARRAAASIATALGDTAQAATQLARAEALRTAFERAFWCTQIGSYALALDGARAPCRVRASNAGHLLFTGIADPARAARVAATLMDREMYNGWGIRTLGTGAKRYNPMSYHNGSVWPHDNAIIAMGLARYGLKPQAEQLFTGLFESALYVDLRRLPELFCGFRRRPGQGPTFYPVACSPQAWAATSLHAALGACLGLSFDPAARSVVFDRPCLPPFLNEVTLHHLTLGEAHISVVLRRAGGEVAMHVAGRSGDIRAVLKS